MSIIVQKFGGTSVKDAECIKKAAAKAVRAKEQGHQVVVTVSARAGMTDELINLAKTINGTPDPRELDMLVSTGEQMSIALMCMTLHAMGHKAISFTGGQCGIITDDSHTNARIQRIDTTAIRRELKKGKIVVVAGFQGIDPDFNITTLGRGASDLTAVALAAALRADMCEIYTDVDGVYTADPRVVPDAAKLDAVNHDEILELASRGAKVLQSRCVEVAKKFRVPLKVLSTFEEGPGTVVCSQVNGLENSPVTGAAISMKESRITLMGIPDKPGTAARIVGALGERRINMSALIQAFPYDGAADISLLVDNGNYPEAMDVCKKIAAEIGAREVAGEEKIGRVSVVGNGMVNHPGTAAEMCAALGSERINIKMITTSDIYISCVVDSQHLEKALRAVHKAFGLSHLPASSPVKEKPLSPEWSKADMCVEGFHTQAIECDHDQAELKVRGLKDRPGEAARMLAALAHAGVNLDVVLQNACSAGISLTMKRSDADRAKRVIEEMNATSEPLQVTKDIAKIAIRGVGLRSHAGAASKICDILAREGVNIQMIGTSEAQFSVLVPDKSAERAVKALRKEFGLKTGGTSSCKTRKRKS